MPTVSRIRPADGPAVAYAVALRDGAIQQHAVGLGCAPGAQQTGAWSASRWMTDVVGADGDAEAGLDLGGVSCRRGVNKADQATLGRWGLAVAITLTGDHEYRGPSNIPLADRELCALLTPLPFRSDRV